MKSWTKEEEWRFFFFFCLVSAGSSVCECEKRDCGGVRRPGQAWVQFFVCGPADWCEKS